MPFMPVLLLAAQRTRHAVTNGAAFIPRVLGQHHGDQQCPRAHHRAALQAGAGADHWQHGVRTVIRQQRGAARRQGVHHRVRLILKHVDCTLMHVLLVSCCGLVNGMLS